MNYLKIALLAGISVATFGCDTAQKTAKTEQKEPIKEVVITEPVVIGSTKTAEPNAPKEYALPVYNASATRLNDLIHTKLEVGFDWSKQHLLGKATITAKPYFYPTDELLLDAKSMDIKSVVLVGKTNKPLKFEYKNDKLLITLDKIYQKENEYTVLIDYVAKPEERQTGGSAAITSDKGLYFINPLGKDKDKPMQIWTQGETESASCWFPTIDKPNERCTEEIFITIEDKFKTLSNGLLISSTKNTNGTRTDYWKQDKPHAPYLFMMAIGDFSVTKDKWRDKEIMYYVEPEYAADAKLIYNHTPDILEFFSTRLGVDYPWDKMAHVIVREYVSGAMENTSAIIYGDFCQKHARELMDEPNDNIVAHEMFHHWFGDYVTCESWSNLTVNESFANYSETLWQEHKYGKDAGDAHLYEDFQGYLGQARSGKHHNLVNFGYLDKEDMFDAISYNKGGCILHQLRNYLGDDAFFKGLQTYLTDNKFNTGEAHQLRLAMEKTTGQDLNWYWNQWYFNQGHPVLAIDYVYNEAAKKMEVTIKQTQDPDKFPPIFELPLDVDVYYEGKATKRERIRMTKREQTFSFDAPIRPSLVNVDATKSLVGTKKDNHSDEEWVYQYYNAPLYLDRLEAIKALKTKNTPAAKKVMKDALNDKFHGIREDAVGMVDATDAEVAGTIAKLAENDPKTTVRATAMLALVENKNAAYANIAKKTLADPKASYGNVGAALQLLQAIDSPAAMTMAKGLEKEKSGAILSAVAKTYAGAGSADALPFFENRLTQVTGGDAIEFLGSYSELLKKLPEAAQAAGSQKLMALATDMTQNMYARFASTRALSELKKLATEGKKDALAKTLTTALETVKAKETNKMLQSYYSAF
jgi:aminopeptidase N